MLSAALRCERMFEGCNGELINCAGNQNMKVKLYGARRIRPFLSERAHVSTSTLSL